MLSQRSQYVSHREAEIDGHRPGIAVFRQVREGLEGLLEGDPCLAECGVVVGPGAGAYRRSVGRRVLQRRTGGGRGLSWLSR